MNKIIYIILLLLILLVLYFITTKLYKTSILNKQIENFNDLHLNDNKIFKADLDTLMKHLRKMKKNFNTLNKEQKIIYNKILKRLYEEKKTLGDEYDLLLKEIQETNPLNSFEAPAYYKSCNEVDINIDANVELTNSTPNDLTITCASMCKDNSKCLSFEYDNKKKTCKFSKSCHKDSNFIGRQPITNIIYTKKGGKQPAKSNYDIYKNKKLLNYKPFNDDINVPCDKNKIGETIGDCDTEKASQNCDDTPDCLSWELHKPSKTCNLYSKCHKPMLIRYNFKLINPPKQNRSPDNNAWGRNKKAKEAHNRGEINSPQAWSATSEKEGNYYEITLNNPTDIAGIITQGRKNSVESISKIKIKYFNNNNVEQSIGDFRLTVPRQTKKDQDDIEYTLFNEPVELTIIRFYILDWNNYPSFRVGLLQNLNNIKKYVVGTKKETSLLGIQRNPRDQHIPLQYGEDVRIYNGDKFYLREENGNALFSKRTNPKLNRMKIYKAYSDSDKWGKDRGGTINYGDFIFIQAQSNKKQLHINDEGNNRNAQFLNNKYEKLEKFIIEKGPGSKGNHGTPIYSDDIIYIRSLKDRRPFRLQNGYNRGNNARFGNYNQKSWERMVITIM